MRKLRIVLWAAVAVAAVFVAVVSFAPDAFRKVAAVADASVGGPFELERVGGGPFSERDLSGAPHVLFFGFTNCPEVCPTTLWEMTGWLKELGPDADRLKVVFVTVDPERDTAEKLREYMTSFDPRIIALTGTAEQVEGIKKAYRVYSRKVPTGNGDYTVDHTASVYLMHGDGRFSGTIAYGENPDTAKQKLRRLIDNG